MAQIKTEAAYRAAMKRIDELLPITGDEWPSDDPNMNELVLLSDLVEEYEKVHCPIEPPTLVDAIKLSLFERDLTQKAAAELLGISPSRMSDLVHGRMEPSYRLSRALCKKLDIPPAVVLGL